ncbi:MAG TPA: filamentous hemagglutinin N-terminal domain-containing protein, partial [Bryobacteraceae bacterium]|nr:filamentous hemagglutinin N-terminal domain-containing protein [Bryobacteraceae bacterium]
MRVYLSRLGGQPGRNFSFGVLVTALCAWLAMVPYGAQAQSGPALPHGGSFVAGAGTIGPAMNGSLSITQSSARGVINWNSFSIGAGGLVVINNGSGATLSRVTGGDLSRIDGLLKATGSLYLINPNGVVVGANGCVMTDGSFAASTRNIATGNFMAGGALTASGTSAGGVMNQGAIVAREGDVVLIGRSVANSGSISAPRGTATLATGDSVLLTTVGGPAGIYVAPQTKDSGRLTQTGRIEAAAAALKAGGGDIYTLAGNRTGLISATGANTVNGEVWLSAPNGKVVMGGDILARNADATGGLVVANGAEVTVAKGARISAQGSSGGTVLVGISAMGGKDLAGSTTVADGASILAGGAGGGGLIETSGHSVSIGKATISGGNGGEWRVDPTDLTIDAAAASTVTGSLNSGTNVTEQTTATTVTAAGVQSAGAGDINVAAPISWTGS